MEEKVNFSTVYVAYGVYEESYLSFCNEYHNDNVVVYFLYLVQLMIVCCAKPLTLGPLYGKYTCSNHLQLYLCLCVSGYQYTETKRAM